MPVASFLPTDFTTQDATTYKAALDGNGSVLARLAAAFAPSQQETPNMTMAVGAGALLSWGNVVPVAAQSTGVIAAPVANPRIDRVVIDAGNGVIATVTGTESATPTAPPIPAGFLPIAQVLLTPGMTGITNAMITDERITGNLQPAGSVRVLAQSAVPRFFVAVAATFTAVTVADNAGNVQLASSGAHGLTATPAVGSNVYVAWTGGAGISGFYKVLSVDSATAFTIQLAYAAGLGAPTVMPVATDVVMASIPIPAGLVSANGSLDCEVFFDGTPSANGKTTSWYVGATRIDANAFTASPQISHWRLINRGVINGQLYALNGSSLAGGLAVDLSQNQTLTLRAQAAAANEVVTLEGYVIRANY
ncbi:putative uncharacterized protein [Burkholderiales bacterium GJ-E10]|nr:putative uncharacterized protein [Burkholderiales bacterium GJ-E10]